MWEESCAGSAISARRKRNARNHSNLQECTVAGLMKFL